MLQDLFIELGFSNKEQTVYLALLKLGSAKPHDLVHPTGINRTTIYDLLESLLKKGVVTKFKKQNKFYFQALSPRALLAYIEHEAVEAKKKFEKLSSKLENSMPELMSLQLLETKSPKISFFEGEKGLREAYEDTLSTKGDMLAYTNIEAMTELLPNFLPEYWKSRAKKKLFVRAIFVDNPVSRARSKKNQEELRSTKFFPKGIDFAPEVKIYGNKTLIALWEERLALVIESKEYSRLQKQIFELLWKIL